jgi:hypothetical protein
VGDTFSSSSGGPARRKPNKAGSSVLTPPVGMPAVPGQREASQTPSTPRVAPAAPPKIVIEPCVCGHARDAHEHYRPGRDCGACGAHDCDDYRRAGGAVRRALRKLGLVP